MAVEHAARLERVVEHDRDTRSLFLRLPAPLAFRPGQFISCLLPVGGETLIRPYSIASDPEQGECLELLLNLVPGGPGSTHLFGLPVGATIRFTGPWGTFVLDRAPGAEAVFIADGTGIAPIRPMLRRALTTAPAHPLRLLYATSAAHPAVYGAELEDLARAAAAFDLERVPSDALEREVVRRYVERDAERRRCFFICGVGAVVPALRDSLRRAGYERRAVQYEKW
jgi:ferredoxin-NADP reductase